MRILLTVLMFFFAASFIQAQHISSCCTSAATDKFAVNASDEAFKKSHEEPIPFTFISHQGGHDINFTAGGKEAHAWLIPAKKKSPYYIFVIHEWWGLNDYIKQECEKISDDLDVNVIALDLYDNQVATTREDAAKIMGTVKTERATAIIKGAFDYAGKGAEIFTLGWCFGGGWSMQATLLAGKQSKAQPGTAHRDDGHGGQDFESGCAHRRRACARFPVARAQGCAAQGRFRRVQPLALRRRAGGARARPCAERGLAGALRADQPVRGAAGRHWHDYRQAVSAYQQG